MRRLCVCLCCVRKCGVLLCLFARAQMSTPPTSTAPNMVVPFIINRTPPSSPPPHDARTQNAQPKPAHDCSHSTAVRLCRVASPKPFAARQTGRLGKLRTPKPEPPSPFAKSSSSYPTSGSTTPRSSSSILNIHLTVLLSQNSTHHAIAFNPAQHQILAACSFVWCRRAAENLIEIYI